MKFASNVETRLL